jgi:hypothetical protein
MAVMAVGAAEGSPAAEEVVAHARVARNARNKRKRQCIYPRFPAALIGPDAILILCFFYQ